MARARIGTVDLPDRMDRARYFSELDFLEMSALFGGPLKPSALGRWAEEAPRGALGLVAPWVLTQRQPPSGRTSAPKAWPSDAASGDFRDGPAARAALGELRAAVDTVGASCAVFRSPALFAASAANRDQLRRFFGELATAEAVGAERVWVPDGLWEPLTALAFANEIGVTCAFDPLVREPGQPLEIYFDLDAPSLYFRITGLGRAGTLRAELQDDLAALAEHYETVPKTFAFASAERWKDARNLKKLLAS